MEASLVGSEKSVNSRMPEIRWTPNRLATTVGRSAACGEPTCSVNANPDRQSSCSVHRVLQAHSAFVLVEVVARLLHFVKRFLHLHSSFLHSPRRCSPCFVAFLADFLAISGDARFGSKRAVAPANIKPPTTCRRGCVRTEPAPAHRTVVRSLRVSPCIHVRQDRRGHLGEVAAPRRARPHLRGNAAAPLSRLRSTRGSRARSRTLPRRGSDHRSSSRRRLRDV